MSVFPLSSLLVLILGVVANSSVQAELTVIYDSGQTQPLAPLLRPLLGSRQPSVVSVESHTLRLSPQSRLGAAELSNLLPIRSPGLSVGDGSDRTLPPEVLARLAALNPRPLFLVGADEASLHWLAAHRERLNTLGAMGLLIEAETEADVWRVAEVAQGLPMTLGSGSDLAAALGIQHYPVLISGEGIEQ